MNRILLLALTAGLVSPIAAEAFWKYTSLYEARAACSKWSGKGGSFTWDGNSKGYPMTDYLRNCIHEDETNQFLGREIKNIKNGAHYKFRETPPIRQKVMKRFKY